MLVSANAQEQMDRSLWWALVPGGGQFSADALNKRVNGISANHSWRGPIYFGAVATSGYFVVKNQIAMNSRKNEWRNRLDAGYNSDLLNPAYTHLDNASLFNEYHSFQSARNTALAAGIFFYVVSFIDAYASHQIVLKSTQKKVRFNSHYSDLGMTAGITVNL
jgi:hypothetical protein